MGYLAACKARQLRMYSNQVARTHVDQLLLVVSSPLLADGEHRFFFVDVHQILRRDASNH